MLAWRLGMPAYRRERRRTSETANYGSGSRPQRIKSSPNLPDGHFRASNNSLGEKFLGGTDSGKPGRQSGESRGIAVFLKPRYHLAATSGIMRYAGRLALRAAELPMNRRNFLLNTGIVGAGLLGAGHHTPRLLRAGTATNSDSNLTLEDKPVAFTLPPLPYSFDSLEPYIDARRTPSIPNNLKALLLPNYRRSWKVKPIVRAIHCEISY